MQNKNSSVQCVRYRFMLWKTIKVEEWLHKMAIDGFILSKVQGDKYWFTQTVPQSHNYFVMSPETGANSEDWVFYEFELHSGKRIPCEGNPFLRPSHMLQVRKVDAEPQVLLQSYYYQYRNYRLLKRFKRNASFSAIFLLLGVLVSIIGFPGNAIALFPYVLGSGLLLYHSIFSYLSFRKDCLSLGFTSPQKRPIRPIRGQGDGFLVPADES